MSFVTVGFPLLVCAVLAIYLIVPQKVRWVVLLAGSAVFYLCVGLWAVGYISVTAVSAYLAALGIDRLGRKQTEYIKANSLAGEQKKAYKKKISRRQKLLCALVLAINFGILAVLKYSGFAADCANGLLEAMNAPIRLAAARLLVPMGISFYTFQTMGYLIDVSGGKYPAERNVFKFLLFVSFFPQLVQGPISRYDELSRTLFAGSGYDADRMSCAFFRILWGYFKKLVVADRVAAAVMTLTGSPDTYAGGFFLLAALLYAVQMYADFTGGIDIAIGVAQLFGVVLPENFNHPFLSRNIEDYWRRWHITLGTWFRDYLFYPLSTSKAAQSISKGSRRLFGQSFGKRVPVYLATLTVWFTTGLWHGASGNFVLWGILNGVIIIISQMLSPVYKAVDGRLGLRSKRFYSAFEVVRTFCLLSLLRVLDCYTASDYGRLMLSCFVRPGFSRIADALCEIGLSTADWGVLAFGTAAMIAFSALSHRFDVYRRLSSGSWLLRTAAAIALLLCIIVLGAYGEGYDSAQFIYNRF